jgi:molybdenum cofactor cytidylyltransferase
LQAGLREVLNRGRDAAMITLVDRPPVNPATVQTLYDSYANAGNNTWAIVPEFSGKHGHPFLAGREMIEAFLQAPATSNARDVERGHQDHVVYVAIDDPSIGMNINTPDDYAHLVTRSS